MTDIFCRSSWSAFRLEASRTGIGPTHLDKDLAPLLNDVGVVLQVVFGGLTDVDLHALLRQRHKDKTNAKAKAQAQSPKEGVAEMTSESEHTLDGLSSTFLASFVSIPETKL